MFNSLRFLLLSVILIVIEPTLHAQDYIGTNRSRAVKILIRTLTYENIQFNFTETDTSLHFILNDDKYAKEELYLHFSNIGLCDYTKLYTKCTECITKHFSDLILNKHYHWKKLNDKRYASTKKGRLILEILGEENSACPYIYLYRYRGNKKEFKNEVEGNGI